MGHLEHRLTLSVASQILKNDAYMSGAELRGIERGNPLAGVLEREEVPLEERTGVSVPR